jgi:transcription initiation factor TFIID subunit TAF12
MFANHQQQQQQQLQQQQHQLQQQQQQHLQQRSSAAGPPRDGPDEDQVPVIGKSCYTEVGADRKLTCAPTPIARKEIKSKKRAKTFPEARNGGPSWQRR